MPKNENEYKETFKQNGKEYLSTRAFSERTNIPMDTIQKLCKRGKLNFIKVGSRRFLCWETESKRLEFLIQENQKRGVMHFFAGRGKKTSRTNSEVLETKEIQDQEEIQDLKEVDSTDAKQLLKNFDENDFKDCLLLSKNLDGDTIVVTDADGKPVLDWKMVDRKITALIRNLELKRKENELIAKDDVTQFLSIVFTKTRQKITSIPPRFASRFASFYQKETGKDLSNTTKTDIKMMLETEAKHILADITKDIEESDFDND